MVDRKEYQNNWQKQWRARKHGGVMWPKGRPAKFKPWPPEAVLHCIYCSMILMDEYHIKNPCWKSKLSMIFAESQGVQDNQTNGNKPDRI